MSISKRVRFSIRTRARWWLTVDRKDVPIGRPELLLEPRDEPYLLFFYFQGTSGTSYQLTVAGAKLLQPVKGAIAEGWSREGGIAGLRVSP